MRFIQIADSLQFKNKQIIDNDIGPKITNFMFLIKYFDIFLNLNRKTSVLQSKKHCVLINTFDKAITHFSIDFVKDLYHAFCQFFVKILKLRFLVINKIHKSVSSVLSVRDLLLLKSFSGL